MARIDILWLGLFIQLTFFIHTRWEYFGAWSDVFTRDFWPNGSTFTSACRPWFLIAIHVPMYTFFVLVRILFLNSTKASLFSDSLLWILSVTWYPRGTEREKHTSMYLSFLFRFFDSVWYFERFIEAAYRKSCSFNYLLLIQITAFLWATGLEWYKRSVFENSNLFDTRIFYPRLFSHKLNKPLVELE